MRKIKPVIRNYINYIFHIDRVVKLVTPSYIVLSWLWPYYYTVIILPTPTTELKAKLSQYAGHKVKCLLYSQWWIDRYGIWGSKAAYSCKEENDSLVVYGPIYGPSWSRTVSYNTYLTVKENEDSGSALSIESYLSPGYLVAHTLFTFVLFLVTWFILLSGTAEEPFRNAPGAIFPLLMYLGLQVHYRIFINEVFRFIEDVLILA